MPDPEIFVLGSDGNLWLETGPYGPPNIPPFRTPVDGNVDLFAAFQAFSSQQVFVCGSDGDLWLEQGPWGKVPLPDSSYPPGPGSRYQIDGSVAAFWAWSPQEVFVLGRDGNLWLEFGFGTTNPTVPPPRTPIDGNVAGFQPLSLQEVFVLGGDGNLWHELAPFGAVPLPSCNGGTSGCRNQVDANVLDFWAVDSDHVFVLGTDHNLWLEQGPFGQQIPPLRTPVDANAALVEAIDADQAFVVGTDDNLWLENSPFGVVPLPPCSQTSGFGQGFRCRDFIFSNVAAFGYFQDAGGMYVVDGNLDFWQVGPPNVQIDGSVIAFQPLSSEQTQLRTNIRHRSGRRTLRPVRASRHRHSSHLLRRP
jgi:hypothetical protein